MPSNRLLSRNKNTCYVLQYNLAKRFLIDLFYCRYVLYEITNAPPTLLPRLYPGAFHLVTFAPMAICDTKSMIA